MAIVVLTYDHNSGIIIPLEKGYLNTYCLNQFIDAVNSTINFIAMAIVLYQNCEILSSTWEWY